MHSQIASQPIAMSSGSPASDGKAPDSAPMAVPAIDRRRRTRVNNPSPAAAEAEFRGRHSLLCARIDKYFAWLMLLEWAAAIALSLWIAPVAHAGAGDAGFPRPQGALFTAIVYGGALTLATILMTRLASGKRRTRFTVALAQMLMSSLLIQVTGARFETQFHVFGSLAFLALYLDWQVLAAASATIVADHVLRELNFPFSIYAASTLEPWRWLAYAGWITFCDLFLVAGCRERIRDLRALSAEHVEREALFHNTLFDTLTGLPNRSFLSKKMTNAIQDFEGRPAGHMDEGFCCLYIDLDRFKDVNELMGHGGGDALLSMLAGRIQSKLGEEAFLARLGGDEFIAMVPQSASERGRAEEVARTILRSLLQPFQLEGRSITLGASIGISRYPQDGQDAAELLLKSDRAMYSVKRAGRNDFRFHSAEMSVESRERAGEEQQLRRAIERREFRLVYQPIFRASGGIAGLEALLRWPDPERGNIPPSYFIPLAEETGLIVQLGSFVLHEACKQATEWYSRGLLPGRIAVNVSSVELAREDYAEAVILALRQHYTPPQAIDLEVTETALVNDFALAERHLRDLHLHGIRISIDDFGTGYSSLGRLKQLTLDTLKIDRLFVEGVATADGDRTVVEHIISMAHTLGMNVVAEGVETQGQFDVLRSLACDQIQGYLLAKPMDKESAEALLVSDVAENCFRAG